MSAQAPAAAVKRLALGTAQFGLRYGVANEAGQVTAEAAAAIVARAASVDVDTLDTAVAYGTSEACLGDIGVASWRVISKLPPLPADVGSVADWVDAQLSGSLRRLRISQLDALLLHRPADLLGDKGGEYRDTLSALKERGLARAVGISIYRPEELDALWPTWQPDIVQAPFNVLDRRIVRSGWYERLADSGVRLHTRSAFLQGLLLMPAERRPAWFAKWRDLLARWDGWCRSNEVSPLAAAVGFVARHSQIERYVIGVDSVRQLEEILGTDPASIAVPDDLWTDDVDLIDPSRWRTT